MNGGKAPAIEEAAREKAALEEQLRIARDERSKLQRDINAIQQQAESYGRPSAWKNALLRERINDIAAEVAKLAIQLEGPNSPIEAMLAGGTGNACESDAVPPTRHRQRSRRGRRHAGRAHQGAAIPRFPRPASSSRPDPSVSPGLTR